jgi:succinate dehydrogenase/fumarate reductase cytochrome b subunit
MGRGINGIARFIGLALALPVLVALVVLSVTPVFWDWIGRPDEEYPELFMAMFLLPALVATAAGIWIAVRPTRGVFAARVVNALGLAICVFPLVSAVAAYLGRSG